MNIFNNPCDPSCDKDNSFADKFKPLNGDVTNIYHPCASDCREPACDEILEGFYTFTAPMTVRSLCDAGIKCDVIDDGSFNKNDHIKHSFAIRKMKGAAPDPKIDRVVGAVWKESQGSKSQWTEKCAGEFYVHYKWNPCWECEPLFEEEPICCDPCA